MPRRERKKQETRWRMYDAAMSLFAKRDYESVKIEDICEQADASNAAFFHHFTNKAALVRANLDLLKTGIGQKLATMEDATGTQKLEMISGEVRQNIHFGSFTTQMFAAVSSSDSPLDMEHIDTGITGTLSEIISKGQASGEFNKNCNPQVMAVSLAASWLMLPMAAKSLSFSKNPFEDLLKIMLASLKN